MTAKRLLTSTAVLACLLLAAAPAGAEEFGGAAVQTYDDVGGGIVAPGPEPATQEAPAAEAAQAQPAQEETPTTPEGEEQPPDEENGGEPDPDEEAEPVNPPGGGDTGAGGESGGGSLPHTGLELLALSAIGLGLLLAGGALWPTSSWPPPRDRLRRSLPRR